MMAQQVGGYIKDELELQEELEPGEESRKWMEEKQEVELLQVQWMNVEERREVTLMVVVQTKHKEAKRNEVVPVEAGETLHVMA